MRSAIVALSLSALCFVPLVASAAEMNKDRVEQCVKDNDGAKVQPDIIRRYCACMSEKIGNTDALSVTEWERTHPKEREECDNFSGWAIR